MSFCAQHISQLEECTIELESRSLALIHLEDGSNLIQGVFAYFCKEKKLLDYFLIVYN